MPTYEYLCAKCGQFDLFQNIKDKPLTVCPKCKGRRIKRQIGRGAGILFKGNGFYQTDYRSPGYQSAAKADGVPKVDPAPAKSDSKPAAKAGHAPSKKTV